ncbi:MAG: VOC family protein [Polaromonas sp.]|uniref:VOC family protein n=1 Tax=Polaromonas sp. TaxID=1869339 RepID=UPI002719BEAA|nr:VOC family protein [Polaromonas sp.]MDO9114047.1 VOC family protein [Polaromonas sp.]MDP3613277.1 VOC family protein [Rubrivivax sp.]
MPKLQEALRFYTDALGYEVKATYGPCIVQLKTGSVTLLLQEIEAGDQPSTPTTVLVFQTEDIQASMRSVVDAGGELLHSSPQKCPVGVFVRFKDTAGVLQELLQFENA